VPVILRSLFRTKYLYSRQGLTPVGAQGDAALFSRGCSGEPHPALRAWHRPNPAAPPSSKGLSWRLLAQARLQVMTLNKAATLSEYGVVLVLVACLT
jgi:hypothetical protein